MKGWEFRIGRRGDYRFVYDSEGGLQALADPSGQVQVIGVRTRLSELVEADEEWSEQKDATGNNAQISDGAELYAGAQFGDPLIRGQVEDALWGLGSALPASGRLLEVGCGPGFLLEALQVALPEWQLVGVDPSSASVAQARSRGLDVRHGFADTADLAPGFDAVVVMGNLQLHPDLPASLDAFARLAVPGARLYVDSKNPLTLTRRLAGRLVRVPGTRRVSVVQGFAAHAFHGLRHCPTQGQLLALLERAGWKTEKVRTTGPRLLRYENSLAVASGAKGHVWRVLDRVDGWRDQRAWIQVSARKR